MRRTFLVGFLCLICFTPAHEASAQVSSNTAPVAAIGMGVAGIGFLVDVIMSITVGSQATAPSSLEERTMVDRATGLQVSALAMNFVATLSCGLTLIAAYQKNLGSLVKTARFALPVAMATTTAAAFLTGFAGQQLDSIAESLIEQRNKFHVFAIMDYVFAGVAAGNLIPTIATTAMTLRAARESQAAVPAL